MFANTELINEMDSLRKFAFKLTNNVFDAEDLLQSTILRAIEKKHLFETGTNLFSWTSKIMFNLFVSNYRRKKKFETQYDPDSYIETRGVDANQDIEVELREVESAMNHLSGEHREMLMMVCVHGMQYAEVSEALNIPIGTVRSRLSRARESLQTALDRNSARSGYHLPRVPRDIHIAQMAA